MATEQSIPIDGLLENYEKALTEMGYSVTTKLLFMRRADLIIRRHMDAGLDCISLELIAGYVKEIDDRYFNGSMQKRHHTRTRREIDRFVRYASLGRADALSSPLRGARISLKPEFERIAGEFLAGDFHPNTRCDIRWAVYRYFAWLGEQGYENLEGVAPAQIQNFLLACSQQYSPSGVHNIRLYLKKLYAYLHASGLSGSDYHELFSFTVNRERKVFPPIPKSDIAKMLDAVDRTSPEGCRDYAVLMLGTVLGLRACDVAAMKLTDIDWRQGTIKIIQSKTSNPVILPLTQDVGEALQDYILHARPESEENRIFLRVRPPHTALAAAVTVGEIYQKYRNAAGLEADKRFHNFRRCLGTSMVSNNVSVYDTAQVLGDRNVESTKPYISTDREHLKMCSLPFDGIMMQGGERA